jgi:hypothetical protein
MHLWARDDASFGKARDRKLEPIEAKESSRWLEGYRLACDVAEQLPDTQIVSIADREADIYECFPEGGRPRPPRRADWIIVEEIQLETEQRLRPCLALYKIVAWRVLYVAMLGRTCPELPCDAIFAEEEWKSAYAICRDVPPPRTAPPLKEFLAMLAELGGYNGRRHDAPPGPKALWIAIRRTCDFALAWRSFGPEKEKYV